MIPKILLQTSKEHAPEQYVLDQLFKFTGADWTYSHFTNIEMSEYLQNNVSDEFPLMAEKFESLYGGHHKADLFRLYYLYVNGGVYIDSDAMLEQDINYLVETWDLFTAITSDMQKCLIGFIGTQPNNPIIKEVLKFAYDLTPDERNSNYFMICEKVTKAIQQSSQEKITVLIESGYTKELSRVFDPRRSSDPILIHYHKNKIIPNKGIK